MKYIIGITEILHREIEVEADNEYIALDKVKDMYNNEEIVLSSEDYLDSDFEIV